MEKVLGLTFLRELKDIKLPFRPLIIVATNIRSDLIYNKLHESYADMIFYKKQPDFSPDMIIKNIVSLWEDTKDIIMSNSNDLEQDEDEKRKEQILKMINYELDKIGISYKLTGRKYMIEGIYYILIENKDNDPDKPALFQYLACKHKQLPGSIGKVVQTAINDAWRKNSIDDLKENYTARVDYNTGVPTPTEFIYYYADKLKNLL